jgi:hypothetical protein
MLIIKVFYNSTPLARIYRWFLRTGRSWEFDDRIPEKAYFMACLSEVAYLYLAEHEIPELERYKLFPSALLAILVQNRWHTDIRSITGRR